ncbi:hypothetical protein IGI04_043114 [Brassica rapa subsp. trilocularis]|uniref:Uncharacterized protein n=1 Tax=Brassica rapa subsp. trilocularis TaxID=1813537 RepID=A0ABQ7KGT4_BRACM|nr:hypothetical protein IGI04_043114 [Brassica rapa subsp. trilocularis]
MSVKTESFSHEETSVAVSCCVSVTSVAVRGRQTKTQDDQVSKPQDVRQHKKDVRQHTQDVRGCPCVSVCPSVHTGRPSVHTGRPSAHTGRPWPSVSTHRTSVIVRQYTYQHAALSCGPVRGDFGPRGLSVQYTQDVGQHTQDVRACPLAHTDCPWTDPCTELISACCQYTYQHAGPSRGLSVY